VHSPRTQNDRFLENPVLDAFELFLEQIAVAQLCKRRAMSFRICCATGSQFCMAVLEVLGQLLDYLRLASRLKLQPRQAVSDLFSPVNH
jgi:hypothetical protein